jgi:crotonobetaine/carnitine-CoA ligase
VPHQLTKAYGAPIPAEIDRIFREEFGVPVMLEGYGMTEIPGACNNPFPGAGLGEMRLGAMGRPARHPDHAMPFAELRVLDDDARDVVVDTVGELAVRTPMIMKGYYRDPDATKAAFRDGWFLTGDLVRRDADGYYWFVARKKDIIRRRRDRGALAARRGRHPRRGRPAAGHAGDRAGDRRLVPRAARGAQGAALRDLPRRAAAHPDAPRREVQAEGRQDARRAGSGSRGLTTVRTGRYAARRRSCGIW